MKTRIKIIEHNDGNKEYIPEYKPRVYFTSYLNLFTGHVFPLLLIIGTVKFEDYKLCIVFSIIYLIIIAATIAWIFGRWEQYNGFAYLNIEDAKQVIDNELEIFNNKEKELNNKKIKSTKIVKYP